MEYKFKIDVASIEDTEILVKFQLAMAKESEGTELDYETVREGVKLASLMTARRLNLWLGMTTMRFLAR